MLLCWCVVLTKYEILCLNKNLFFFIENPFFIYPNLLEICSINWWRRLIFLACWDFRLIPPTRFLGKIDQHTVLMTFYHHHSVIGLHYNFFRLISSLGIFSSLDLPAALRQKSISSANRRRSKNVFICHVSHPYSTMLLKMELNRRRFLCNHVFRHLKYSSFFF